jgi:carboxyl-terminal processing protease
MNDRKANLTLALLPTAGLLFALLGFFAGYLNWGVPLRKSAHLAKVRVALDRIQDRYYGEVPADTLLDGALEGMTAKLDPYCEYFTAQEYKEFRESVVEGKFGGVGIVIGFDRASSYVTVETPIEGTPAFEADILPGDQIREVDGKSIKGQLPSEVARRIKGAPDTQVVLTMFRKGREPFQVTLVRKVIVVKAVKSRMLEGGVGYIRVSDFTEMVDQFKEATKGLQDQGMKALVIDLRFNGGGLLDECVKLADLFLEEGKIVTTKGRTDEDGRVRWAEKAGTYPPLPLVLLVNEGTASASEVFAGALRDHGRAALVGARTFGKGSVQTPFPLPDGSYLKLTTARYFTPNGTSVHREEGKKEYGIDPDYRVEMSLEEYDKLKKKWNDERIVKGERPPEAQDFVDHQLQAALEVVRAKLENREPKVEARVLQKDKPSEN